MTKQRITDIHNYCIGGCVPFKTMEREVKEFLNDVGGVSNEEINQLKKSERRELELEGYFDY